MTSNQFLDDCARQNRDFMERGRRAVQDVPLDILNRRTVTADWSPAQIFKHLLLSNDAYVRGLGAAVNGMKTDPSNAPVHHTWFGATLAKYAGPDKNVPAPKQFVPSEEQWPASIVDEWAVQQQKVIELIEASKGKDLNTKCFKNPVMPLFKMTLADCIWLMTTHTDRHIRQIEERAAGSC